MNNHLYFALWAEDINQYLNTAYNSTKLNEVREYLLEYVSQDNENPKGFKKFELLHLLGMTGLSLEYCESPFPYKNELFEIPSNQRIGKLVERSFLE